MLYYHGVTKTTVKKVDICREQHGVMVRMVSNVQSL